MPAGKYDITIEQGSTFKLGLRLVDTASVPIDLTDYTARMQVRREVYSETVLLELTTENGRIAILPSNGSVLLEVEAEATAELSFNAAVYDLETISGSGEVARILQGTVTLSKEVTR